ncbi:MAG: Uma2 family endonuclease [Candidatus Poribacteria bacterium]|nr:Uma2 family endonuclease [Candidatus Poribacteria bacterium]
MSQTALLDPLTCALPIRRLTVAEYHQMGEAGILSEDDRVELIDGVLIQMSPKRTRHSVVDSQLATHFYPLVLEGQAILRVQEPIILSDDTEPEPDLALVNPCEDAYLEAHPSSSDILLLIEVSDTTLETDKEIKLPRYAASGIPEVWIVNLVDDIIEVYQEPRKHPDGTVSYRKRSDFVSGDVLTLQVAPSLNIAVDEVLV